MNRQQELFAFLLWKQRSLIGKMAIVIREADHTAKWFVLKDR